MNELQPRKTKFKHTRELVRIALDEGLTQDDIARHCRVAQSVVSQWSNGRSKAFEHQIEPLKRRFGHRLQRAAARVYLVRGTEPAEADVRLAARIGALIRAREAFGDTVRHLAHDEPRPPGWKAWSDDVDALVHELLGEHAGHHGGWSQLREAHQQGRLSPPVPKLVRVEGPVLFRHTFEAFEKVEQTRNTSVPRWKPVRRWIVHRLDGGRVAVVDQRPRLVEGVDAVRWSIERSLRDARKEHVGDEVHARADDARWLADIHELPDVDALLAWADAQALADDTPVHDRSTAPFLLRKALIGHGHDVPGITTLV